jgi:hypothetical protein
MVDCNCGFEITPVAPETVRRGACEAECRVTFPARSVPVLTTKGECRCFMIELEDGIQLRPGLASVTIGASQDGEAMR